MNNQAIQSGEIVVCKDNQDVEAHLVQNEFYTVEQVSHRGALLKVSGVELPFASARFTPVRSMPPVTEEVLHACD